ncbi:pyridoxamine kinase [Sporomusa acidovorans]|uniref:pyridoxamine kinase n=1 Tax=Sporomusa acidovorans TaxID=112900 RepID=UPI00088F7D62|nr:pyridoxamine kinase [Sporomusa acidovorans]OZC14791.1 pyridoxine kinase [Sporomusa acidovorans DSM 3132]SDF71027.1 pyridoxine kinase [Sporomusa acidovorans]
MNVPRQKRIAVVNDITGFGRCSVAAAWPIISAMKIQCCPLPTAILSAHTGFPKFFLDDYTAHMRKYMHNWEELGIEFDGICTGFLGSAEQVDIVIEFLEKFTSDHTTIIVDPVMGDYGKLYSSYTQEMCHEMKRLVNYAHVLTPNLTEACQLLDIPYPNHALTARELEHIAQGLCAYGPRRIVISGLPDGNKLRNFVYEQGKPYRLISVNKIGEDRSGTGDVFVSIVAANLVKGIDFATAVEKAANFISKTIAYTVKQNIPVQYGICFEEYLTDLK